MHHLVAPDDGELAAAVRHPVDSAAIMVRDDAAALRYALALAHLEHSLPLVVTIFDRTMAEQLRAFLPQATVFSPAAAATPSLPVLVSNPTSWRASWTEVPMCKSDPGERE